ncbi:UPF0665 family C23C4.06c-like protein [Cladobotryum mycophilum]|uniref:UPF0665 family C23C4.06c-like protein n=1 Tax=Cladobotryum mycophilum TaxID=491253 RepID=A0ABR0STP4_9HYPO
MHYIRFLRAPALTRSGKRLLLELVLTINTDLSDFYFLPDAPVELMVYAEVSSSEGSMIYVLAGPGQIIWRSGLRVLKPTIDVSAKVQAHLKSGDSVRVCVSTRSVMSASGVTKVMESVLPGGKSEGQVMPAYFALGNDNTNVGVATRRLALGDPNDANAVVEFEEELGESMARHIWDGGVVAFCKMANTCILPPQESAKQTCLGRLRNLMAGQKRLNVLELGCGIGVLGVGLAAIYPRMQLPPGHRCTILMTDLEDAERRTRANMTRLQSRPSGGAPVELLYENLDWQDGRRGHFGPEAQSRRWDMIMLADCTYNTDTLPALVETLSALHRSNQGHASQDERVSTKVFLATKNRHESEREVLDLLSGEGWNTLDKEILSLPVLGADAQTVELYLFEKL